MSFTAVILAGGKGKRMNSEIPKVLHTIRGIPMIVRILNTVKSLNPSQIIVVVGHKSELVQESIQNHCEYPIEYAYQFTPQGTGHALNCAMPLIRHQNVLILCGDVPLISSNTLEILMKQENSILTWDTCSPKGYGRIIEIDGKVQRIVEEKNASKEEKEITLVNAGVYYLPFVPLFEEIKNMEMDSVTREYYLTSLIEKLNSNIVKLNPEKWYETMGVNTQEELESLEKIENTP